MATSGLPLPRSVTAGLAALFLGLTVVTGLDLAHEIQQQSELRQIATAKHQLALTGELELGRAVQDFKDCLLRNDASYCEDFDRHLQAIDRTVAQYTSQGTQLPREQQTLRALGPAVGLYRAALYKVRDMQSRDATIQEIDNAVKGDDRPIAAALAELADSSSMRPAWQLSLGRLLAMVLYAALAVILFHLTFPSLLRRRARSLQHMQSLQELSDRIIEWDETRKARAFARLHDGVCQSLTGIMYFLQSAQQVAAGRPQLLAEGGIPEPVIPSLQAVIKDARAVALQLRPPRLQEAGLLATLRSIWVDAHALNPALVAGLHIQVEEEDIAEDLKPALLRIAAMTLESAEQNVSGIGWVLERVDSGLRLSIALGLEAHESPLLDTIRARVLLSGGSSDCVRYAGGRWTIVSTWPA